MAEPTKDEIKAHLDEKQAELDRVTAEKDAELEELRAQLGKPSATTDPLPAAPQPVNVVIQQPNLSQAAAEAAMEGREMELDAAKGRAYRTSENLMAHGRYRRIVDGRVIVVNSDGKTISDGDSADEVA